MTGQDELPNWFNGYACDYFDRHLDHLAGRPGLLFLQIGAYTGDASMWMLDNVLTDPSSRLVDVDTWQGSDEAAHHALDFTQVEAVYESRMESRWENVRKWKGTSALFLRWYAGDPFDFIYIDGDHTAPAVLADAVGTWPHLKPGGILAFDDYLWNSGKGPTRDPALGINAFTSVYSDQMVVIDGGAQIWVTKR